MYSTPLSIQAETLIKSSSRQLPLQKLYRTNSIPQPPHHNSCINKLPPGYDCNEFWNPLQTLTFPDGLYSVAALNAQLSLLLVNAGYAADYLTITGDDATQRTVITYGATGIAVDFSGGDTFKDILGFDDVPYPLSTAIGQSVTGQNVANFNTLNSYLVHSDLVSQGIPVNATGASILAQVPISARPGSQIVYQPRNPSRTDLTELIGLPRNSFRIWLTNQVGDYIDTNSEDYSIVVVIRFILPIRRGAAGSNTY